MAVSEKIRIRLKSYDHTLIDAAAEKIVETAKRNGATVSGPIPLPTEKEIITILRAVHKYKDSREQFEYRTHKRLIDVIKPSQKTIEALTALELPAGVEIEIKLKSLPYIICGLMKFDSRHVRKDRFPCIRFGHVDPPARRSGQPIT